MGGSGRAGQRAKSARRGARSRLRAMHPSQNRELGHSMNGASKMVLYVGHPSVR
jgi:hypothetical protein